MCKLRSLQCALTSVISAWAWHSAYNTHQCAVLKLNNAAFIYISRVSRKHNKAGSQPRKKASQAHTINSLKLRNYWWSKAVLGHTITKWWKKIRQKLQKDVLKSSAHLRFCMLACIRPVGMQWYLYDHVNSVINYNQMIVREVYYLYTSLLFCISNWLRAKFGLKNNNSMQLFEKI